MSKSSFPKMSPDDLSVNSFGPLMPHALLNETDMKKATDMMTTWMKGYSMPVQPFMLYPASAMAAATAISVGMTSQMAGMMLGMMEGAFKIPAMSMGSLAGSTAETSERASAVAIRQSHELVAAEPHAVVAFKKPEPKVAAKPKLATKPAAKPTVKSSAGKAAQKTAVKQAALDKSEAAVAQLKSNADAVARAVVEAPMSPPKSDVSQRAKSATKTSAKVVKAPVETAISTAILPEDFRRPKELEQPAKPDDLKAISGVGPKLEEVLNKLGIWSYAQISAWQPEEVAWMDDYLQFKGRIDRDNWIEQATKLATGKA